MSDYIQLDDAAIFGGPSEGVVQLDEAAIFGGGTPSPSAPTSAGEGASGTWEGPGVLGTIGDMAVQVPAGARDAVQEVMNVADSAGQWLNENVADLGTINIGSDGISWESGTPEQGPQLPAFPEAKTTAGHITNDISQFMTGFVTGNKALKAAGWVGKGAASAFGRATVAGAGADAFAMPHDIGRLADLLERQPYLQSVVPDYLLSDPEDSEAEARFKNALEGVVVGGVLEGFIRSVKAIRAGVRGNKEEAERLAGEVEGATRQDPVGTPQDLPPDLPTLDAGIRVDAEDAARMADLINAAETFGVKLDRRAVDHMFNQEYINRGLGEPKNDQGMKNVIELMASKLEDQLTNLRGDGAVRSEESVRDLAKQLGMRTEDVIVNAQKMFGDVANLDSRIMATRILMDTQAAALARIARKLAANPDNPELVKAFRANHGELAQVMGLLKGTTQEVGRALKQQQYEVGVNRRLEDTLAGGKNLLDEELLDDAKIINFARRITMVDGDRRVIVRLADGRRGENWDKFNEFYINSLLSGIKTTAVNLTSNIAATIAHPIEHATAGALQALKGNREGLAMMREAGDILTSDVAAIFDSMKLAARAFRTETNVLDPLVTLTERTTHAIAGTPFQDAIGKFVRLPSRLLMTQDEFFKQMNYRGKVRAGLMRQARRQGLEGDDFKRFVDDGMEAAFDLRTGAAVDREALQWAREATFTQDLGKGTMGHSFQQFVAKHPAMRLIFPFVRTPTNIFRASWQRVPGLGMFQHQMRADLAAGGERAARAMAKQAIGTGLYSAAAYLAYSGAITGRGPSDPELRKQMMDAGWQPYSFRFEDGTHADGTPKYKYVSFQRLDPFASPLGIVADTTEQLREMGRRIHMAENDPEAGFFAMVADLVEASGELSSKDYSELATVVAASSMRNVTSKTYMRGLVETMDAVASGEEHGVRRWVQSRMGALVPNLLAQTNPDPVYRDVQGLIFEPMMARVPGLSNKLPPRVNIFNEPTMKPAGWFNRSINPFTTSASTDDVVKRRLLELGKALPPPPETLADGRLDLTDPRWKNDNGETPYQSLMRHLNKGIGGRTLKQHMEELVTGPVWPVLSKGTREFPGGQAFDLARNIYGSRLKRAELDMLEEFPELKAKMREYRMSKLSAQTGTSLAP